MPAHKDKQFYADFRRISEQLSTSFRNRTPLVSVGIRGFTITDIVALGIQSKTNMYFLGSRGTGKTLLAETMRKGVFNDEGFYLRGDINLQLKDLMIKLNLQGKTEEEVYQVASERIAFNFALVDELNRVPPIIQNQFLNILDGYIEIRGQKYLLGKNEYLLMAATGNYSNNGEYTGVFDEDVALLDRIPLIIDMDEVPFEKGDVFAISENGTEKTSILQADLSNAAIQSHWHLKDRMKADAEINAVGSLLKEFIYGLFRYVEVNAGIIDKAQKRTWRDMLRVSGEHAGGSLVSFCSDISVRTLQSAGKLAFAMYKVAEAENEIMKESGMEGISDVGMNEYITAYLESLRLALNYDRRFIPSELSEELGNTHAGMISSVFADVSGRIDPGKFTTAAVLLMEFSELSRKKNERGMGELVTFASSGTKDNPVLTAAVNIMEAKMREARDREKSEYLRENLERGG